MVWAWVSAVMLMLFMIPVGQAADNLKAFPPAVDGMVRYVLQLPSQADESVFMVGLIIGKTVQVDERNKYFFVGKIEVETIKGWGFTGFARKAPLFRAEMDSAGAESGLAYQN